MSQMAVNNPHSNAIMRNDLVPIYHQLYQILRDRILSGEWQTGDLLPPEPELMAIYDVSRITVRKAVELLANENLVYKRRGKGTFVSMATLKSDASRIVGFEDDMAQRGMTPSTRLITKDVVTVSRVTAEKMNMEVGDELAFIKRLRLADGDPILLEEVYLVHKYCPGILQHGDFTDISLFDVLEDIYDIRIERAKQTITAMVATPEFEGLMKMSASEAVIFIERISYSQLDIPVEFRRMYYRADRYALELALKR
jgi:GntR family transcriptional regulator